MLSSLTFEKPVRFARVRLVTLAASVFLLLAANPHAQAASEFYRSLAFWETPLQVLQPENQISADQARSVMHIRVDRDDRGRISEFSLRLGDRVKDIEGFFGNIYFHAPITRIAYGDGKEVHTFYNQLGGQTTGWGVSRKVFEKDQFDRPVVLYFEDADGTRIENSWGIYEYRWTHLLDGSVIEERVDASGQMKTHRPGFEFERLRLTFDTRGRLALMQNIDERHQPVSSASGAAQYRYYYDDNGRFVRWEVFGPQGEPAIGPTGTSGEFNLYVEDEFRSIVFFDQNRQPTLHDSGAAKWHFGYDRYGNVTSLHYTGLSGERVSNQYGIGQTVYQYSDDGLYLVSEQFLDTAGNPVADRDWGFASVRLARNDQGLIVRRDFLDAEGKLVNRKDNGIAYVTYVYDDKGNLLGRQTYDRSGTLLEPAG